MKTYTLKDGTKVTVSTGCIGRKTIVQGVVIGFALGMLALIFKTHETTFDYWWPFVGGFLAPFIVDGIRPVHTYHR